MQNKMEVANAFFGAVDVIVDKKLEKLNFDKTITAKVIKENTDGTYQVQYQNTKMTVYPISNSDNYKVDTSVYVLIPNNKTEYRKFILGSVGTNSLSSATYSMLSLEREINALKAQQEKLIIALQKSLDGNNEEAKNILNEIKGG